ncbi:MAG: hypothetical protein AAGI46_06220 [Planctomycetota bacterium]
MTIQRIKQLHERRPFVPFTIETADGKSVEVRHPEFLAQTPNGRIVIFVDENDNVEFIDLLLVTKLTTVAPIPEDAPPGSGPRESQPA